MQADGEIAGAHTLHGTKQLAEVRGVLGTASGSRGDSGTLGRRYRVDAHCESPNTAAALREPQKSHGLPRLSRNQYQRRGTASVAWKDRLNTQLGWYQAGGATDKPLALY